jgi:hypothetical protein
MNKVLICARRMHEVPMTSKFCFAKRPCGSTRNREPGRLGADAEEAIERCMPRSAAVEVEHVFVAVATCSALPRAARFQTSSAGGLGAYQGLRRNYVLQHVPVPCPGQVLAHRLFAFENRARRASITFSSAGLRAGVWKEVGSVWSSMS